ncbi:MAG: hypothetical protein AAF730_09305 [Bacteroidota bacterium]
MTRRLTILWCTLLIAPLQWSAAQNADPLALGDAAYAAFDNATAVQAYVEAYRADTTSFEVLTRLARTYGDLAQDYLANDQRDTAKETFETAIGYADALLAHHPECAETYFFQAATRGNLALFAGGKKKVEIGRDVEANIQRALDIDPDYALAYLAYGIFKREVASLSWLQRNVARLLFGALPSGSKEEAADLLRQAVQYDPSLTRAHFELAVTLEQIGQKEAAIDAMEEVLALPDINTEDQRNRQRAEALLDRWQ